MKYLSLFSGIGAFEKALDRLKINYELVGFSEIDKYAVKSYCAIHGVNESLNMGDITKLDETTIQKDIDLVTYGFPCQDISIAGKQQGLFNDDGTQTRSGIFFEALRIIESVKPRIAIAENVKNLTSKKFNAQFKIVLESLECAGYNNYWQILNSKDYGVPQNRERLFIVSIRKDVDTGTFRFPKGFQLELRLKDLLEDNVDKKFYLSKKMKDYLVNITEKNKAIGNGNIYSACDIEGIAKTVATKEGSIVKDNFIEEQKTDIVMQICNIFPTKTRDNPNQGRVYDKDYISPSLNCMSGGNREPFIVEEPAVINPLKGMTKNGWHFEQQVYNKKGITRALKAGGGSGNIPKVIEHSMTNERAVDIMRNEQLRQEDNVFLEAYEEVIEPLERYKNRNKELEIRKLTPKECFRLMDFDDDDFEKAQEVNSNTQLYKQAGNSIVVSVVYYIFKSLIEANILIEKENKKMELKVNEVQLPEHITFNYEELKQELTEKVSMYETLVYTDEQIKDAKSDRAQLNKLKKALNDERIRLEREYMIPFNDFKSKINEIIGIIDKPVSLIDKQVKEYEEQKKREKQDEIISVWKQTDKPDWLSLAMIESAKWLNASVSIKIIQEEINARLEQIENDIDTLSNLPEFGFEATEVYKSTLDVNKALNEGRRLSEIQKKKAEHEAELERMKNEAESEQKSSIGQVVESIEKQDFENCMNPPVEDEPETAADIVRQAVCFKAWLTTDDALALKAFFNSRNIEFEAI